MASENPKHRRRWWLVALVVVVAWGLAVSVMAVTAKHHANSGLADIRKVDQRSTGGLDQLVDSLAPTADGKQSDIPDVLRSATDEFRNASDLVGSPVMAPALILPVAGRQLRSARALSSSASTVGSATAEAYDSLAGLLTTKTTKPEERLAAGRQAEAVLRRLRSRIAHLDLGPGKALVGNLANARRRFSDEYGRLQSTTTRAIDAVTALNSFLTGPTNYVLLASNNGEMRSGSGSYLQVGLVTVQDAKFSINELSPTRGLALAQPGATMDPDVAKNWGWLEPNQEWRNLNLTPRYDESARMATEMWATQHPPVQGALNIDVAGLKALLGVVGAVQVGDLTVDQNNVERYLLLDQYKDFGDDLDLRPLRDEKLAAVAKAALEAFNTQPWSSSDLLHSLLRSGRDRHIMLWSNIAVQQRGWKAVDADGEIPANGLMLSVINRGGNKLDQFLHVDADLVVDDTNGDRKVHVTVHMKNVTPTGLPRYVQGPYPHFLGAAGTYLGIVQLTMPGAAGTMTMSGGQQAVYGDDGPSRVMGTQVYVPRGQTVSVEFDFALPKGTSQMLMLPSARLPASTWTLGRSGTVTDGGPHLILLG
jgi:Protein of unknown function (DUF4012)